MQTRIADHDTGDDLHPQPETCLSFRLSGPWGHFRRVEGNTVKTTYRIIPRTTVAGLLAAVLGVERNGYYQLFGTDVSAIAIEPLTKLRTLNLPANNLTTSSEGLKGVNTRGKVSVYYPDPTADRQRTNYEVLVNPAYRIDVWLNDDEVYDRLRSHLEDGKSHYTPSLGLSEYLANIQYLGEFDVSPVEETAPLTVDSAVPDADGVVPEAGTAYGTERSPGFMQRTTNDGEFTGRRTTTYLTYTYSPEAEPLRVDDTNAVSVDDRTVMFR